MDLIFSLYFEPIKKNRSGVRIIMRLVSILVWLMVIKIIPPTSTKHMITMFLKISSSVSRFKLYSPKLILIPASISMYEKTIAKKIIRKKRSKTLSVATVASPEVNGTLSFLCKMAGLASSPARAGRMQFNMNPIIMG